MHRLPSVNLILFLITLLTTLIAGTLQQGINPLEDPPIEIAEQGINAIREYFHQNQAEKDQRI